MSATEYSEEQYEQSFADIVATASAKPEEGKVLAVHMWEWGAGEVQDRRFDAAIHSDEIAATLALMANDKNAEYNDWEHGWGKRVQYTHKDGMLGMPCTGIALQTPCVLFNRTPSATGVLIKNAPIVLAVERDAGSAVRKGFGFNNYVLKALFDSVERKLLSPNTIATGQQEWKALLDK